MDPQILWAVVLGILLLLIGIFLFRKPDLFWRLTERWKSYQADEPSDLYRISTKFGGVCLMFAGAIIALLPIFLK